MKIENTTVFGFLAAFRAMRNPMESWDRSDSSFWGQPFCQEVDRCFWPENPCIGPEDLKLACKLIRGGSEHRKFLRQIMVWTDLTLPRYVWCELDTYRVATVRNSCSTMHKLGHRDLTPEDFEGRDVSQETLRWLNDAGTRYRAKLQWDGLEGAALLRHIKARLPEAFLQKATWTGNYETLLAMYLQRKNHRLPEWPGPGGICDWIYLLPYMPQFIAAVVGASE